MRGTGSVKVPNSQTGYVYRRKSGAETLVTIRIAEPALKHFSITIEKNYNYGEYIMKKVWIGEGITILLIIIASIITIKLLPEDRALPLGVFSVSLCLFILAVTVAVIILSSLFQEIKGTRRKRKKDISGIVVMGIIILIKGIAHKMQTILLGILLILLRSKMNIPVSVATRDIFSTQ